MKLKNIKVLVLALSLSALSGSVFADGDKNKPETKENAAITLEAICNTLHTQFIGAKEDRLIPAAKGNAAIALTFLAPIAYNYYSAKGTMTGFLSYLTGVLSEVKADTQEALETKNVETAGQINHSRNKKIAMAWLASFVGYNGYMGYQRLVKDADKQKTETVK